MINLNINDSFFFNSDAFFDPNFLPLTLAIPHLSYFAF